MELPLALLGQTIQRGTILHSHSICDIDHGKFFVVMGVSDDAIVGFFFINSSVNKFLENKPEQYEMQYIVRPQRYPFLRHDSFVNMASLIERYDMSQLTKQLSEGITTIVGTVDISDMETMLRMCRQSRLYSPRQKRTYFY